MPGLCAAIGALLLVLTATPALAKSDHRSASTEAQKSADGPPVNLVPWALSDERRAFIDQVEDHDRRTDPAGWPQLKRLPQSAPLPGPDAKSDRRSSNESPLDRVSFGRIESPIGAFAVMSREVDQYGRVRAVDFLTFDNPNSHWDMKLKVNKGAVFQITRHWGASGGPGPFAALNKTGLLPTDH
jgi:hypothetical protein